MKASDTVGVAVAVNHRELKEIIKAYYKAKKALFIWGAIGIGKSRTVREAAKELAAEMNLEYSEDIKDLNDEKKFMVIDIRLAQCDPSDLRGIPIYDKERQATVWLPPELFPRKGYGIIFLDEFPQAPPLVQNSAFQLILDRRLGTYVVPDGYMLIAAGNRLEDRAAMFELSGPLKNRFGHVELQIPSVEEWTQWALNHGIDVRIVGFLQFRRQALYGFDPKYKENAFPTPRTWEFTSDLIKNVKSLPVIQKLAATQVGLGTATELVEFIKIKDRLKPIEYYLKDPEKCELPTEAQLDLQWALVTALADYYKDHSDKKTLSAIVRLLKRFPEEYAMFTLKMMVSVNRKLLAELIQLPETAELAEKLADFFE